MERFDVTLSGQAPVLRRLAAYWLEVLRDDKRGKVRRFFRIKKALAGQTRRRVWWMGDLRIVFQNKKTDESKVIAFSGQAHGVRLVAYWLEVLRDDKGLRAGYFF